MPRLLLWCTSRSNPRYLRHDNYRTCVGSFSQFRVVLLGLQEKFDSFDGGCEGLGDGAGCATEDEVFEDLGVAALSVGCR
jgi:hypothetical protein